MRSKTVRKEGINRLGKMLEISKMEQFWMMRPQRIGMESDFQKEWKYRLDKGVVQSLDFKEGPVVIPGACGGTLC